MSDDFGADGPPQLTIDGGEVSSAEANAKAQVGPGFTGVQRAILEHIREVGYIRSVEAGVIVHANRVPPCTGGRAGAGEYKGPGTKARLGCCGWAASDGLEAMKRLADRGVVVRGSDTGVWIASEPSPSAATP